MEQAAPIQTPGPAREADPHPAARAALQRPAWRRWGLWILRPVLLAGLALAWRWWRGPAVPMVPVSRQALTESLAATGRLRAPARIELAAELAGTVAQVLVREGQSVRAGDVLVALQDREARAALLQAQAAEREAAGRVQQLSGVSAPLAQQTVLQAQAGWQVAQREHGRVSELVEKGFFAPQRLDEAKRALDVALSALTSAQPQAREGQEAELMLAQARWAQARAAVRLSQARLERLSIRSPVPGRVLEVQRIDELDDARLTELRGRTIGFVFQYHHLLPAFTAPENVLLPLMLAQGVLLPQDETLGRQLLASVGLDQALAKRPGELSGGMQQRVALARALARKPRLILADEPTGNLDSASAEEVFALLRRFNKEHGSACPIVTHDASLADRCDRTIDLVDGRLAPAQARAISRR